MALTNGTNLGVLVNGDLGEQHYVELMKQWRAIDGLVQCTVKDKDLSAPPGSPANGDCYIVGAAPTGAWATHTNKIARYFTVGTGAPAWEFFTPKAGWRAPVQDEVISGVPAMYTYSGSAWIKSTGTASGADIVTSSTDTTAGRLLTVGYHGLGGQSIANDNWDTIVTTGFYHNTSSGATGIPIASVAITCIHTETSTNASQFAMRTGSVEVWKRQRVSGVWGSWIEVWTSSNLVKTSSATDTTAGRIPKMGDYGTASGVEAQSAYTGDVLALSAISASFRVASIATNLPVAANGYITQIYRGSANKKLIFYTDAGATYENVSNISVWGGWKQVYNTGNTSANVQTMLAAADNAAIRTAIGVAEVTNGTFTPVIEGSATAGVGTYSVQVGRYQRVGNTVHCMIHLAWSAHTGTGTTRVAGLPFTAANVTNNVRAITIYSDGMPFTSGNTLQGMSQPNVTYLNINERTPAGAFANHNVDAAVTSLRISFTYEV